MDPDQLTFEEAKWSGSALFVIHGVNLNQQPGLSNLIGWQLEVGVESLFIQHGSGLSNAAPCVLPYYIVKTGVIKHILYLPELYSTK